VAILPIRVIDEKTSGELRLILLESNFIEASFNDPDWNLFAKGDTFAEMVKYGKLHSLSGDLAPDKR
jgi:hypothetical protein